MSVIRPNPIASRGGYFWIGGLASGREGIQGRPSFRENQRKAY